ncbi:MAG TPA: transposase [Candidatus Angelobacter sp.]
MAKPSRNAAPNASPTVARTYFVTSRSIQGRGLLQLDRMANLFIDILRAYVAAGKFKVHEFVVMPNHVHVLLTVGAGVTIERAVQLMKGNFSYRARKEFGLNCEIWQRGFSDVRIRNRESYVYHVQYIRDNPVEAGLVRSPDEYPCCSTYLKRLKRKTATSEE